MKSALVNSATPDVTQDDSGEAVTAQSIGAGSSTPVQRSPPP